MKTNYGFTLIETLTSILLTGLVSSSLFLGLTEAQLYIQSVRIKEKAHQELKEYTENIKSMIASGVQSFGIENPNGIKVILSADENGEPIIKGTLHKEVRRASSSGDYSVYYYLHTYIVWQDKGKFWFNKNSFKAPG